MKGLIALFIVNILLLTVFVIAFLTTYHNCKYDFKSNLISGKVSKVKIVTYKDKSRILYGHEYEINNIKDTIYKTSYSANAYKIKIGDIIVSKKLFVGETNSKILLINNEVYNTYYSIFDFVMLILLIVIPIFYFHYYKRMHFKNYKNKAEEYKLIYNRKRKLS